MQTLQSQILWCTRAKRALAAIVLVAVVAFYFLDYRPQKARLKRLGDMTLAHQAELRSNQSKAAARNEIAARNEKLRQELDRIKKPSQQQELADLIRELTLAGDESALRKFVYRPGSGARSELFCEMPITLSFEGDFVNIFSFLRRTEEMQRLTRVRSLSLKGRDGRGSQVQAQMVVNIYYSAD